MAKLTNLVFVGTYTKKGGDGIYAFRMDSATGAWTKIPQQGLPKLENPSFLAVDLLHSRLFAVSETAKGEVAAYGFDPKTGALTFKNKQLSGGADPCHLSLDRDGHNVLVAHYSSGSVTILPTKAGGLIGPVTDTDQHQGSGPNKARQDGPHAHSVTFDLKGRYVYACDLGNDQITPYGLDRFRSHLTKPKLGPISVKPGAGPRHFTFHPRLRYAYVINELDCTVTAFAYDLVSGGLKEIQTVSTLPKDFSEPNTCADIHISPDGRFLYGSNRGHNSIVQFAINGRTGQLTLVGHTSTQGKTPRNFAIAPTGGFLYVANQDTDNIVAFAVDRGSGKLTPTGQVIEVPNPVCIQILPALRDPNLSK